MSSYHLTLYAPQQLYNHPLLPDRRQLARTLRHKPRNLLLLARRALAVRKRRERRVEVAVVPGHPKDADEIGSCESDVWPDQPGIADDAGEGQADGGADGL